MIRATDIHSLTDFTRHAKTYVSQVRETRRPIALTVNGDAQVVVQDAQSYQEMVDLLDKLEHERFIASLREAHASAEAGDLYDADEVFDEIRRELEQPEES